MALPESITFKAVEYKNSKLPTYMDDKTYTFSREGDGYNVKPTQILVKIKAAALNPIDLVLYRLSGGLVNLFTRSKHGFGRDYAGVVEAIGSQAARSTKLKKGDRVCGLVGQLYHDGSVAEYFLCDTKTELDIVKIPDNLSFEQAAAFPLVVATAVNIVEIAKLKKDLRVVIIGGLTSVGRAAIQLAKNVYGVSDIVAVCSGTSADEVEKLGAKILDYKKYPLLLEPTQEMARDRKFDAIIDCVGNNEYLADIQSVLKPKGEYVTIVGDSIIDYGGIDFWSMIPLGLRAFARAFKQFFGLLPYHYLLFKLFPGTVEKSAAYMGLEKVKVKIDSIYPFDDYNGAVDKLSDHQARGKVVITVP